MTRTKPRQPSTVTRVDSLYDAGDLLVVEMTQEERLLAAKLQSNEAAEFGLRVPLGPGEAACVAISAQRGWTIATDDSDAYKALDIIHGGRGYRYERIRRLLIRAADEGQITRHVANDIHAEMCFHGFWDSGKPFP